MQPFSSRCFQKYSRPDKPGRRWSMLLCRSEESLCNCSVRPRNKKKKGSIMFLFESCCDLLLKSLYFRLSHHALRWQIIDCTAECCEKKWAKKCKRAADYATPLFIVALSQFILNSFALSTQLELKHDIELKLNIKKRKVWTIPGFGETLPTLLVNEFWWFCY